jgi:hypothetical protein
VGEEFDGRQRDAGLREPDTSVGDALREHLGVAGGDFGDKLKKFSGALGTREGKVSAGAREVSDDGEFFKVEEAGRNVGVAHSKSIAV